MSETRCEEPLGKLDIVCWLPSGHEGRHGNGSYQWYTPEQVDHLEALLESYLDGSLIGEREAEITRLKDENADLRRSRWHHNPDAPPEHFCDACDDLAKALAEAQKERGAAHAEVQRWADLMSVRERERDAVRADAEKARALAEEHSHHPTTGQVVYPPHVEQAKREKETT